VALMIVVIYYKVQTNMGHMEEEYLLDIENNVYNLVVQ
jgi:hypothetical protein